MKSDERLPVAIVGGGASGTILAVQLARRGIASALIDGSGRMGRGVAYSTTEPAHLLNVRAEGMSAIAGDPQHFARRFTDDGGDSRGFAQRRYFGAYLGELLQEAIDSGLVRPIDGAAVGARRDADGWSITLADGQVVTSDALALAIGNQEPEPLRAFAGAGQRFVANPWGAAARSAIEDVSASGESVLLVGTGLTMVDVVLSLNASGYSGRIVALSRRGLVPRAHADFDPQPIDLAELPAGNLRALARWIRRRSGEVGWRVAIDSLRPHSHPLWQSLDQAQQQRFLRHARPWWDVHRHRIAPEVARTVRDLIAAGQLEIVAGRVTSADADAEGIGVVIRRRGSSAVQTERFAYAFNCTGPLHAIERSKDPMLQELLHAGQIGPDQLGIGIAVDDRSRVSGGNSLWALGPLTKGRYWEIVAVPDIREQAAAVADDIAQELCR